MAVDRVTLEDYGDYKTAWCPGCGNFPILKALKESLVAMELRPHEVLLVSGIGQAAKTPHYINANVFNGLHGRALPAATGAKLANPELVVIVTSGDGCSYGEGGNHFLAAIRRNVNITLMAHNNGVYGLTKGQASPTSQQGFVTKTQPDGVASSPFNPLAVSIAMKAGFVARGFSGRTDHLSDLIQKAVNHKGFSLIDILQPCVSFNKVNTFGWYNDRCYELDESHDPYDFDAAMKLAQDWNEKIPLGVIYKNDRPSLEDHFPIYEDGPLVGREVDREKLNDVLETYA